MKIKYVRNMQGCLEVEGELLNEKEVRHHATLDMPNYWWKEEGSNYWQGTNISPVVRTKTGEVI